MQELNDEAIKDLLNCFEVANFEIVLNLTKKQFDENEKIINEKFLDDNLELWAI